MPSESLGFLNSHHLACTAYRLFPNIVKPFTCHKLSCNYTKWNHGEFQHGRWRPISFPFQVQLTSNICAASEASKNSLNLKNKNCPQAGHVVDKYRPCHGAGPILIDASYRPTSTCVAFPQAGNSAPPGRDIMNQPPVGGGGVYVLRVQLTDTHMCRLRGLFSEKSLNLRSCHYRRYSLYLTPNFWNPWSRSILFE